MTKNFSENQRGSVGAKLLITLVVLFLIANAGYNVIPALYQSSEIKQEIHTAVVQGSALPGSMGDPAKVTKGRLERYIERSGVEGAIIDVKNQKGVLTGSVKYSREIEILPFGLYKYQYNFDHTEAPAGFLMKQ